MLRTGSAVVPASVRYATVPGSAVEGQDFLPRTGVLEFGPGERRKEIHITLVNDDIVEPNEIFHIVLSDSSPGTPIQAPNSIDVQIINDDHGVEFESAEYRVGELGGVVELQVRRTGISAAPVTVDYETRDVTATAGQDYEPYSGTLYFDYGFETSAVIVIQIRDDPLFEGGETFQVVLRNPTGGASLGKNAGATVTIVDNDTPGRPGPGVDGVVRALAAQADGNVMVGGNFTTISGVARTALARVHADLSLDDSFDAHLEKGTEIRRIALQPTGEVIVTGTFTNIQGTPRTMIARLQPDGTLDQAFAPTFLPPAPQYGWLNSSVVKAMAVQPDGKILVSGTFTSVNGVTRVGIARLNAHGSVDPSFVHGVFVSQPPWSEVGITDMLLRPDGKIVIGGVGNTIRDAFHNTVLRLESNGSLDPSFVAYLSSPGGWGDTVSFSVAALAAQRNGQMLVLGPSLVRLLPNGQKDETFTAETPWYTFGPFPPTPIASAWEGPDGVLWFGGSRMLIRARSNGTYDTTLNEFSLGTESRLLLSEYYSSGYGQVRTVTRESPEVTAFVLKADGRIVIGGNFTSYGGLPVYGLADVYPDGTPYGLLRLAPPTIIENGRVNLNLIVPVDEPFALEHSSDMTHWQSLLTTTSATNRVEVLDPDPLGDAVRFYRLRRGGP